MQIAWKLSDIRGIDPEFCSHKILFEDDYEPSVQHQRRVNPKIHDVIKKEVEKLLDAGLIYPFSDSPWDTEFRGSPIIGYVNAERVKGCGSQRDDCGGGDVGEEMMTMRLRGAKAAAVAAGERVAAAMEVHGGEGVWGSDRSVLGLTFGFGRERSSGKLFRHGGMVARRKVAGEKLPDIFGSRRREDIVQPPTPPSSSPPPERHHHHATTHITTATLAAATPSRHAASSSSSPHPRRHRHNHHATTTTTTPPLLPTARVRLVVIVTDRVIILLAEQWEHSSRVDIKT
ncbi:hypothetical protein Tco_1186025 [Tanacetum coccineum]